MQFIRGEIIELNDKPKTPQLPSDMHDIITSINKFQKVRNFDLIELLDGLKKVGHNG
jgi:hypothetical protein